jgi:pimeloyl-ACP methyl ester carboxylesterase
MEVLSEVRGQGSPLVLVGGGLTGWLSWEPHAERISCYRQTLRVQSLNVQLGLEDNPLPDDYSVKSETASIRSALDSHDIATPSDFASWSQGALVTLDFALDQPDLVRSMVLIEPPAVWVLDEVDAEAEAQFEATSKFDDAITEDDLALFARMAGFVPPDLNPREMPGWPSWVEHRRSLRNVPIVLKHEDSVERLKNIQCPVLLVKGTGSSKFLHDVIDVLAFHIPHADIAEWPAGHAPHIVSMEPFLDRLVEFHRPLLNDEE